MPAKTDDKLQEWVGRNRPPRVHITYDVETRGAIEKKELPFVVGILADLSGESEVKIPVKEKKFIAIDRDNFEEVLKKIAPRVTLKKVPNKLTNAGDLAPVTLNFNSMEDFEPLKVIEQVEDLKKLYQARQLLSDLLAKLDGNDDLRKLLDVAAKSPDDLKKISEEGQKPLEGETPNA